MVGKKGRSGRKKGSKNHPMTEFFIDCAKEAEKRKISPAGLLFDYMGDEKNPMECRLQVAEKLLPYCHKKQAQALTVDPGDGEGFVFQLVMPMKEEEMKTVDATNVTEPKRIEGEVYNDEVIEVSE